MPEETAVSQTADERSPYEVADAVVRTIAELDPGLPDEEAVWSAFVEWRGGRDLEYIDAIRKTRHSIFYTQLQHLYDFGIDRVGTRDGADFCARVGSAFAERILGENIHPILQVALARPGTIQTTVVTMIREHFDRWGGNRYALTGENRPDEIVLTLESRQPERVARYLAQFGLDSDRCFRNSFRFIAGVVERYVSRVVADQDAAGFRSEAEGQRGRMWLPIRREGRFDYETLTRTLIGYIRELETRQRVAGEEEQCERDLVVGSSSMRYVWERIRKASRSDEIVLLRGESGTGKSFIARKIHELSPRRDRPLIYVALTSDLGSDTMIQSDLFGHEKGAFTGAVEQKQGLFSLADGGTIFLDEIGDASPELQAKLLRVVEASTFRRLGGVRDIRVDVRIITATNRDLEKGVEAGTFRKDLYYRLNVIPVRIPPLRERQETIPALADFLFARAQAQGKGPRRRLAPGLAESLKTYAWPGNVRELEHALKHAIAMADGEEIGVADLPETVRAGMGGRPAAAPEKASAPSAGPSVIDDETLRLAIRSSDPRAVGEAGRPHEIAAHIEYAKATWLAALIDECGGDLALIARFWDRSSEKTLRNLVRAYGLADRLAAARARASRGAKG